MKCFEPIIIQPKFSNPKGVVMTQSNNTHMIQPEIVMSPSVSNLSVDPIGTGMFSVTMQVIMVVRFPTDPALETHAAEAIPETPAIPSTTVQASSKLIYGNGELPDPSDGETECFQAFVDVNGYVPATRDLLIQWATSSQGGA
jgi:hypothetical protein